MYIEAAEELAIRSAHGCVHKPQESLIRAHIEGFESTSVEMVRAVKGL